jgi:DNA ligase-associated metallophosphoesterase
VHLLPERALWWPGGGVLFVADVHLGKAASFRALGQPVPGGSTHENLQRLDALIAQWAPRQLVFLGDFLHGPVARRPATMRAVQAWRERHLALPMTLVRGNHDRNAGDPPPALRMHVVADPHPVGPFACCHEPRRVQGQFVLAGHLHPVCRIHGAGRDHLRLRCFVVDDDHAAVLPAFGEFTGGWPVDPAPGRRLYGIGDGRVWALPQARDLAPASL